jgi:hypothetical protein
MSSIIFLASFKFRLSFVTPINHGRPYLTITLRKQETIYSLFNSIKFCNNLVYRIPFIKKGKERRIKNPDRGASLILTRQSNA